MGDWGKWGIIRFFVKIEDLSMAKSKAKSNKNTQNPKDNQEKMTDKGIQEHSEHTVENKQPESKDNVQNKNEPTCLCNFFTKMTEWICSRKNKNSNKAEENTAKNNDAAQQEEVKQTDYLEIISKLFGISTLFGTFIGGFFIYNYLKYLGQLSIFPDVITNPSALIATTIVFGFILLCFIMQFVLPFLYGCTNLKKTIFSKFEYISIRCFFFVVFFLLFLFALFFLYIFTEGILLIFSMIIIVGFDCILYYSGKLILKQRIEKNILTILIFTLVFVILSILIFIFNSKPALIYESNHFVRFAESPKNSSWYLLHNNFQQNNGSQETSGIDKNDLFKLKQKFKCSVLSEKEKVEKDITCSSIPEQRNNALYGYMAWNLGDTKVFCPPTAENNKGKKEAAKLATECIVISGKFLQILNENYIDIMPKER